MQIFHALGDLYRLSIMVEDALDGKGQVEFLNGGGGGLKGVVLGKRGGETLSDYRRENPYYLSSGKR